MPRKCTKVQTVCANPTCGKQFLDFRSNRRKYCCHACYVSAMIRPVEERFWAKVEKTEGCWLWQAALDATGYGKFSRGSSTDGDVNSHKMAWELAYGPIPEGFFVCHNCPDGDNKRCCRPDHLWLGTNSDNQKDAIKKGQRPRTLRAKLSIEQALEIRRIQAENPMRHADIAKMFGVSKSTISLIVRGRIWQEAA